MSFQKCIRRVELAINSDGLSGIIWLPKKFIRFKMKVRVGGKPGDFLSNHSCQFAMMKDASIKISFSRMGHSFVERDADLDRCFDPVPIIVFIHPVVFINGALVALSTQLSINTPPITACNIFWTKGRVSNYINEMLEA